MVPKQGLSVTGPNNFPLPRRGAFLQSVALHPRSKLPKQPLLYSSSA